MYYIGNFTFFTDQEQNQEMDRRYGDFSMMIEADSSERAMTLFRSRLEAFRTTSSFFTGKCKIYISQLLEFEQVPRQEAVLLNLKSFAGDPVLPYISCVVPTDQSHACSIHDWRQNQPVTEGHKDSLFLKFE